MKANYHTHTWRCNHASGEERAYVERAIEGGLATLGFSDHTPYPFPEGHVSNYRMRMDQLEDYVETVLSLKKEYQKDIEIHLGLEVEYYPDYFQALLEAASQYPIEYFLLAQHFLGNEIGDTYSGDLTRDPRVLERYCAQVEEAMKTGRFTYLAHPDLIHFVGDEEIYDRKIRELCRAAARYEMPLEINFLGLGENRHYPDPRFWKIVGEEGNAVIFGCDAHKAASVWEPEVIKRGEEMVSRFGLHLVDDTVLRSPFGI